MRMPPLHAVFVLAALCMSTTTLAQPAPVSEMAPAGSLRVGFQIGSPILAKRAPDGSVGGIVVDLGKFIADKLGVAFVPVVYANQEAYARSFGSDEWDIVIGVSSATTREKTDSSPDFMLADAMYIAAPGRDFADVSKIDVAGVKVGVSKGGGSDQYLSRALKSALIVRVPGGVPNAVEALRLGAADVWAANPVTLQEIELALPGAKIVPGAWTTGRYAVSLPKGRSPAAQLALAEIVNDAKRTGVVQRSIDRAGFKGVRVAPE